MGRDKAFLALSGQPLLQRALALARTITPEVRIVGNRDKFAAFGEVTEDEFADCGPVGGIHAALHKTAAELNLILAVDLPFIQPNFLRYLAKAAAESPSLVTVAGAGGKWQLLCAIYRRQFGQIAEKALAEQRLRLNALLSETTIRIIDEAELARAGFPETMFRNLNTPDELKAAEKELAGLSLFANSLALPPAENV